MAQVRWWLAKPANAKCFFFQILGSFTVQAVYIIDLRKCAFKKEHVLKTLVFITHSYLLADKSAR